MNAILTIFQSLGVDQTFFVQLAIVLITFMLLSCVLFPKVKEVLELRESKTTKLEGHAHTLYKKADDLAVEYKTHIEKTHQEAQASASKKKSEILTSEKDALKKKEEEIQKNYEDKRAKILAEVSSKKSSILAQADELSKSLLDRLTK